MSFAAERHLLLTSTCAQAGLHKTALRALVACEAVKRLVYVSCNPDTCAKNVAGLCCPELLDDQGGRASKWGECRCLALWLASCAFGIR